MIGISEPTLRKHFREILTTSMHQANAKVAATMFAMATSGQHPGMTAMWMKCRLGWKDPAVSHRLVDADGNDRSLMAEFDKAVAAAEAEGA